MHLATFQRGAVAPVSEEASRENTDYRVDINTELSGQNYNMLEIDQPLPPDEFVEKRLSEIPHNKRKDLIVMDDWCIQLPPELRNVDGDYSIGLTDEQKKFFDGTLAWAKERYGAENLVYAIVHVDETTPHVHIAFVPVVEKPDHTFKVSNTDLHPRNMMYGNKIHAQAEKYLVNYMDRPLSIRNNATHTEQSAEKQKYNEIAEQTRQAEKVLAGINAEIKAKQKDVDVKVTNIPLTGKVVADYSLVRAYKANKQRQNGKKARSESPYSDVILEVKKLRATNKGLTEQLQGANRMNENLSEQNKELSKQNEELSKQYELERAENALLHLPHDREEVEDIALQLHDVLQSQRDIVKETDDSLAREMITSGYELFNALYPMFHEPTMKGVMDNETGEGYFKKVEPDSLDNAMEKRKALFADTEEVVDSYIPYINELNSRLSYGLQQTLSVLREGIRRACNSLLRFVRKPERNDLLPDKTDPALEVEAPQQEKKPKRNDWSL